MSTKTRFEKEAKGNSEMVYYIWLNKVVIVKADGLAAKLTPERDLSVIVLG